MATPALREHIIQTLLYYEIFDHPLSEQELFSLLPERMATRISLRDVLGRMVVAGELLVTHSYYALPRKDQIAATRIERAHLARRRIRIARFMAHIIKRFPFVRAVMVSGDLSKGVATSGSDIDFVIITEPRRLWICRTLLIAFKKVFLFNSRKFFCLNYFIDSEHLALTERDYYTATEIAHLMPLYNYPLFLKYLNANVWIAELFPNFRTSAFHGDLGNNRHSVLQRVAEWPFSNAWADRIDARLMEFMRETWKKRYPEYGDELREKLYRCAPQESRAYGGNFSEKILSLYREKLQAFRE